MGTPIALQDIPGILYQAGFRGGNLINAMAVAIAEAGYTGRDNSVGNNPAGSIDRGLFQINNYWHAEVSDSCAADPLCNAKAAFTISSGGTNWNQWSTWLLPSGQPGPAQALINQATNLVGVSLVNTAGNIAGVAGASGAYANPAAASSPTTLVTAAPVAAQVLGQAATNATTGLTDPIANAINNLANQLGTGINNATAGLTTGFGDVQALGAFIGQPDFLNRALLIVGGGLALVIGIILFALSFIKTPSVKVGV